MAVAVAAGEDGLGDGAGLDGRGCGRRRRRRRGGGALPVPPEPPGRAVQVTWTTWGAEAGGARVMAALPAAAPRVTVTVSVTLCPACSVPQ